SNEWGQNLQSDQGFRSILNSLYGDVSGGRMGSGGRALQMQLDTNNDFVNQARQDLVGQYGQLEQDIAQGTAETDQAVKDLANQFGSDQQAIRDYLLGRKDTASGTLDSEIASWNQGQS